MTSQSCVQLVSLTCYRLSLRYKVAYKKDTGECKLEISMTFADDAGEYSVFAKNQLGEISASAILLEEGATSMCSKAQQERAALFDLFALLTEEYEAYMKEQEVTIKQEVFAMEQEPRVADVPPVFVTAKEPISTSITSGQVECPTTTK